MAKPSKTLTLVARRVRQERERRHLSRKAVAEIISKIKGEKVHEQTIVKLEIGLIRLRQEWAELFARAFAINQELLYREVDPDETDAEGKSVWVSHHHRESAQIAGIAQDLGYVPIAQVGAGETLGEAAAKSASKMLVTVARDHLAAVTFEAPPLLKIPREQLTFVIDYDEILPAPRRLYLIRLDDDVSVRRYGTNPERWEPLNVVFEEILYPNRSVEVLGRVVQLVVNCPA